MKVLIVYAHPEPTSFNGAMKDFAAEVLRGAGHEVKISDLYAMNFNPAGGPADMAARQDPEVFRYQREQLNATTNGLFDPQLKEEMDKLAWADFLIFQFPIWWFSLPAILKGWVDRVFAFGFAYGPGRSYATGMFPEKKAMLAFTTGAPPATYEPDGYNGDLKALLLHVNHGMLEFLGMKVLPPFVAWSAARVTPEQRAEYLEQYRQRLLTLETTEPMVTAPFRP